MRITITLDDDVVAVVERVRRERGLGLSGAVNELVRAGTGPCAVPPQPFEQPTMDLGVRMDARNISDVLDALDG